MGVLASLLPSPSGLLRGLASELIGSFFRTFEHWVTTGTTWVLSETWRALSATTEPIVTGSAFDSEYHVMVLIGVGAVLPLLGLAVIQAIAHQDASGLLRTALLRLPMAILLAGVVIEIVSLGLTATDRASSALLATGGAPAASMFRHLEVALSPIGGGGAAAFGGLLLIAVVAVVSFVLWIELAVRSAAVAVAALFLPLALAGLVWPATSHWARRLGETLTSLVLMKLVMAAVLALAAGALAASSGGIASVVEGLALLGLTACSPYALFRLVPMIEAGAVSHLEAVRPSAAKSNTWSMVSHGIPSFVGGITGATGSSSGAAGSPSGDPSGTMQIPPQRSSAMGDSGSGDGAPSSGDGRNGGGKDGGGLGAAAGSGVSESGGASGASGAIGAAGHTVAGATTAGATTAGATAVGATTAGAATAGATSAGATSAGATSAGAPTGAATAGGATARGATTGGVAAGGTTAGSPAQGPRGAPGWTRHMVNLDFSRNLGGGDAGE